MAVFPKIKSVLFHVVELSYIALSKELCLAA